MKKTLISKIGLVAASALALIFLAIPFANGISGYQMFEFLPYIGEMPFEFGLAYIAPLFILLASLVLLVFSVLALLGELNVIKSEKLLKVARIINLVAAIVVAAFVVVLFIIFLVKGVSPAAGLILTLIAGIAAAVFAILDKVWSK